MRLRYLFLILILAPLPLFWQFHSQLPMKNFLYSTNLGFSLFEFEQAKLREIKAEQHFDLTAVLLHWQRTEGVARTLSSLLSTLLFKEIIIWNNNPQIHLTLHHLINITRSNTSTTLIRIINSNLNLRDQAKYQACVEATTKACFYIDDDWNPSHYIRSLIADFRSDPSLLHSVTDGYTFYTNLVWSYFDPSIGLHAGFSWIGCGSVFLREHAQRHLQLLRIHLYQQPALIDLSDVFFSLWLNEIPSQMNTDIRHQPSTSPSGSGPFSSTTGFLDLQHNSSVMAIRILEHALRSQLTHPSSPDHVAFPRQQRRRFPTYVKSPSRTDDLIFYTNILPLDFHTVPFNISRDFARGTRRNLPQGISVRYFTARSTSAAVDGDLLTCWRPHRDLQIDDFFAVDFLRAQSNVTFMLTVEHGPIFHSHLEMSISFDGLWWIPYRSPKGLSINNIPSTSPQQQSYLVDAAQFSLGFSSFRYIKYKTKNISEHRFEVCELQLITKDKIDQIRTHFQPLQA